MSFFQRWLAWNLGIGFLMAPLMVRPDVSLPVGIFAAVGLWIVSFMIALREEREP